MSKHILIIGDGVIGRCVAYFCLKRGFEVTIIDRGLADHAGCSFGNAGLVVPSHIIPLAAPGMVALGLKWMIDSGSPFYVKPRWSRDLLSWGWRFFRSSTEAHVTRAAPLIRDLNLASRACFEAFASEWDCEFGWSQSGVLNLCRTERGLAHEVRIARRASDLGLEAQILNPKETAAIEPNLRMDIVGAVYYPQDCHMSPSRFMGCIKRQVDKLGAQFMWECELQNWRMQGKRVMAAVTSGGDLLADEFVLCAGAWSPRLLHSLRLRLPIQAGKGYHVTLPSPPRMPRTPMILSEARVAVTPMDGALRLAGTMELAGLDETISESRVARIIKAGCDYLPDFSPNHFQDLKPWSGLRPCTPDGLPYIGRLREFSNLSVAIGHAMMGLSLGPITGQIISEVLAETTPKSDVSMLSPGRFQPGGHS